MHKCYLTDIIVQYLPGLPEQHRTFQDGSRLFLEVFAPEKTSRVYPLTKQSESSWNFPGNIGLPTDTPSIKIAVSLEHSGNRFNQLGVTELTGDFLLARCMEPAMRDVQTFVATGNLPVLEIVFSCFAIPSEDRPMIALRDEGTMQSEAAYATVLDTDYENALLLPNEDPEKPSAFFAVSMGFYHHYSQSLDEIQLDKAILALDGAMELIPDEHPLQARCLTLLGLCLVTRDEHSPSLSDIDRAIFALEMDIILTQGNTSGFTLDILAVALNRRFERLGERADIDKSILAHEDAIRLTPEGHNDRRRYLLGLGDSYGHRFEHSGDLADVESAISSLRDALRLTPKDYAGKQDSLSNLGNLFLRRFERLGDLDDIDSAISYYTDAIRLSPEEHTNKPAYLNNLGNSFQIRFERSRELPDIESAITACKEAVRLVPECDTNKPDYLHNLGTLSTRRFELSGDVTDMELAISCQKDIVHLTPESHANKPDYLKHLGDLFSRKFERSRDLADINSAISSYKDAVRLTPQGHTNKPAHLSSLGGSYQCRFEHSGDLTDVNLAISYSKDAVHLAPEDHADKPRYLHNLGISFQCRFGCLEELVDIDSAISCHKDAIHLIPEGHTEKPAILTGLGNSLTRRFGCSGELADIDSAITSHKEAIRLIPGGYANRPIYLGNLGTSFMSRFRHSRDLADIDPAIESHRDAVHLTPEDHASKPTLYNNLGNSFLCRFECSRDLVDIELAISSHKDAVRLTPDGHPDKYNHLTNLGNSFNYRFGCLGEVVDIESAISFHKDAVCLTPEGHADRPGHLNNLGISFQRRFDCLGELADIESAISYQTQAVRLTPEGHVSKPARLSNLGGSFLYRHKCLQNDSDFDEAIAQFRLAANSSTGPPLLRFNAALTWAQLTCEFLPDVSLDGYLTAIKLLPRLAWLGQTISDRHKALVDIGGVANEAAAAAIKFGRFESALEWLEQGRSIVWGQLLNLRSPVDELRNVQPQLAHDLTRISKGLEKEGIRDSNFTSSDRQGSLEEAAQRHRRLAEEWYSLVEKARAVPGFEDFLRPKRLATLLKAAQSGPVVTINVHKSRCDALVLIPGHEDVIHLPLSCFSYGQAQELQRSLNQSLSAAGIRMRNARMMKRESVSGNAGLEEILSTLWSNVVKPVLDSLAYSVSSAPDPPRIWWCPTGPLSFLPIHAAGIYSKNTVGFKVSDFVTSSYTPTLTALLERSQISPRTFQGLLGVSQPCTPGLSQLPNAEKELTLIKKLGSGLDIHSLPGELATVKSVVKGMEEHSWIHLACHAAQDILEPTKSALCLHDGHLTMSRVISNSFPHADFAFLSACQTAKGDDKLSEEAVHLAAGMLAAGYRSVIATMWSIKDNDAPLVAQEVYSRLFCDSSPDSSRGAHALHHAVKCLREALGNSGELSLLSWVPFIHVGI